MTALLADAVVLVHFVFLAFVFLGGILVLRWRRLAWVHAPAALWAAAIEFGGWICPLTPLENHLRTQAGQSGYAGGFIEHYLLPVVYPEGLTREIQVALGVGVLALNGVVYGLLLARWKRSRSRARVQPDA